MSDIEALSPTLAMVEEVLASANGRCSIIGICGAQGSGKSTLAGAIASRVAGTAVLSLDDLYLPLEERVALAGDVHPLLRTRGVPGTHDIALGHRVLNAMCQGSEVALPRFDKSRDTRMAEDDWPLAPAGTRLVILEGWCVGARPQPDDELVTPINALERDSDPDGTWRRYVNDCLSGAYQSLFDRLDALVLLAAPSFEVVLDWRIEQENALRALVPTDSSGLMTDGQIAHFIAHYERLTRAILSEMPARADLTLRLDAGRRIVETHRA